MDPDARPLVAVVNDDTTFLSLMQELLETEGGYRTVCFTVASTAFEDLQRVKPDLVVVDIRLSNPEGGWMILDLLRLARDTAAIPVIVCSADHLQLAAKAEHLRTKGCDVLPKPFDIEDLLDLINERIGPPAS